jgi:hypothetical protein
MIPQGGHGHPRWEFHSDLMRGLSPSKDPTVKWILPLAVPCSFHSTSSVTPPTWRMTLSSSSVKSRAWRTSIISKRFLLYTIAGHN